MSRLSNRILGDVYRSLILASIFGWSSLFAGETDDNSKKLESVLDKLESKYMDRENSPLTYDESKQPSNKPAVGESKAIKIQKNQTILGKTPNQKALSEVQAKILEFENQVEMLESDTRRFKEQTVLASKTDNSVTIETYLKNPKTTSIRTLEARIDGSTTFSQMNPSGIWIPTSSTMLYNGPLQPGNHTIEILAFINTTNSEGLAIEGDIPQKIESKFNLEIKPLKTRQVIKIALAAADASNTKATAQIIETPPSESKKEDAK